MFTCAVIGVLLWVQPSHAQGKAQKGLQISPAAATKCDEAVAAGMMLFFQANTSFLTLITRMFRHAGLPTPSSITELPVNGEFQVNTKHGHDKYPRTMLAVEFSKEVSGIVSTGTGRNYGVGIFANLSGFATV